MNSRECVVSDGTKLLFQITICIQISRLPALIVLRLPACDGQL